MAAIDTYLMEASTSTKRLTIRDRCGLRCTFDGLLPVTDGDDDCERVWASSIILNSEELEFASVDFKLRAMTKREFRDRLICNHSKGSIQQNDVLVLTYQLPESAIDSTQLTLIIDCSPHEVPLFKIHKSDYYWLGKETNVPTAEQLAEKRRRSRQISMDKTMSDRNVSPARLEHFSSGLCEFLTEKNGISSLLRLLEPHAKSLYEDLAKCQFSIDTLQVANHSTTDVIAEEIIRRFHNYNREKFVITPELLK